MLNNNYEFHALGSYKERLFNHIVNSDLSDYLIDILMPQLDDERFDKIDNFVGGEFEYYNESSVEKVALKGHLYSVPFIFSTITTARNVICIDTNITKSNMSIKEMAVSIQVICSKDNLMIDSKTKKKFRDLGYMGDNRLDIAVAILGDILNGNSDYGIGKLRPSPINSVRPIYPNTEFFGKSLQYICSDFMSNLGTK